MYFLIDILNCINIYDFLKVKFLVLPFVWKVSGNQIAREHIASGYSASSGFFIITETALIGEHHKGLISSNGFTVITENC